MEKKCGNCVKRNGYNCDKFGEIPAAHIEKPSACAEYEYIDGVKTLADWLKSTPQGTIEHEYIEALMNMMNLKPSKNFDDAVTWLYRLKESKSVRAVRNVCFVFEVKSPI